MKVRMGRGKAEEPAAMPMSQRSARTQKLAMLTCGAPPRTISPIGECPGIHGWSVGHHHIHRVGEVHESRRRDSQREETLRDNKSDERKDSRTNLTSDLRVYLALIVAKWLRS
eukprot:1797380-Amphidinium_carterae.3